ncbi:unnamed protein product [Caenorhabditis brenneri]
MSAMALSEEAGRRICMLTEFMLGKPVFESYKSLCSKIGGETISYQEFDFWFHRFAQGKLDLSYDRSLDAKPKELSDMPIDIIEKVADYFSPMDRLVVRCVSQNLRALVENRIAARCDFVCVYVRSDNIDVYTRHKPDSYSKNGTIKYKKQEDDCLMINDGVERLVKGADPFQLAAEHLSIVLKNPDIELEDFWLSEYGGNNGETFTSLLNSAMGDDVFVVHDLKLGPTSFGALLNILPCIVPEELLLIEMDEIEEGEDDDAKIAEIVEMDQWKNVKVFWLSGMKPVPIDSVAHSNRFNVNQNDVSPQEFVRIREILFKSPDFEFCNIYSAEEYNLIAIQEALGPSIRPDLPEMKVYAIPDSTGFLSFSFDDETLVCIRRHNSEDFDFF